MEKVINIGGGFYSGNFGEIVTGVYKERAHVKGRCTSTKMGPLNCSGYRHIEK